MIKSPCIGCEHERDDKNLNSCVYCEKRVERVRALGANVPALDFTLTRFQQESEMRKGRLSQEERSYIKMAVSSGEPLVEISEKLSRSPGTVQKAIDEQSRQDAAPPREAKPNGVVKEDALAGVFIGRQDIYDKLKKLAAAHFRTVHGELLWLVVEAENRYSKTFSRM